MRPVKSLVASNAAPPVMTFGLLGTRTRYARLSRGAAIAVITATLVGTGWCLWITATQQTGQLTPPADEKKRDALLFRSVVDRVHAGEGYYEAWGSEVRSRGYPTRSIFNWRLPLFAWLNGNVPDLIWGQLLLSALALATVLMVYGIVCAESGIPTAMAAVFFVGFAVAVCLKPNVFLTTEIWSGTLIAFSVCAYAHNWRTPGVTAGLLALFFRELALPYCLVSLALACWQKRRGEVLAWISGLLAFAIYLGFHALQVSRHQEVSDLAHTQGWVRFGGMAFILSTVGIHILLSDFPSWTWAFYLPLTILGLAGWRGEMGTRVSMTAGVYLAAFAVVGQPFNNYWGLIDAPLLALGFVRSPASLRDLVDSALRPSRTSRGTAESAFQVMQ